MIFFGAESIFFGGVGAEGVCFCKLTRNPNLIKKIFFGGWGYG